MSAHRLINGPAIGLLYFRWGKPGGTDEGQPYTFRPADVKAGSTGASQYLANEILKAYDIKACNKDGKPQSLELNNKWTTGDMAAMCQWKLDRIRQNGVNLCKGPYGAGEIGPKDWESLLSSGLPFKLSMYRTSRSKVHRCFWSRGS